MERDVSGLYVLRDGTHADPADVSKGDDGVFRHKNGVAVNIGSDGKPQTIGRASIENGNVLAAKGKDAVEKNDGTEPTEIAPPPNAGPKASPLLKAKGD